MKFSRMLNVVLIVVLLILGVNMFSKNDSADQSLPDHPASSVSEVIHRRSSVRDYTTQKVSKEILEKLVRAGMAAPSAMNKQPWSFIIVDEREILDAFAEQLPTSAMAKKAAAAILVCGDLEKAGEGWLQQYWIQDCSAASQNILLAITESGLGGVWTSVYPAEDRMEKVAQILNLPEHIVPLNIIPLGYPSQPDQPKNKWKPENVRWNKW